MICRCGNETETRETEDGFIHGCWSDCHNEILEITDQNGMPIDQIFDLIPESGIYCKTESEAISSYNAFQSLI